MHDVRIIRFALSLLTAVALAGGCKSTQDAGNPHDDGRAVNSQKTMTSADSTVGSEGDNPKTNSWTEGYEKLEGLPTDDAPKLELSEEIWRAILDDEEFRILRRDGTERAFTGELLDNKKEGTYVCAGCGQPLFDSSTKFKSGTGWPSFWAPLEGGLGKKLDRSLGMERIEVHCRRCGGHQGHVFRDGPEPTGLRYCINSASLDFVPEGIEPELLTEEEARAAQREETPEP